MTDSLIENNALVSALVDGQLRGTEFAQAMALLDESAEARQRWHSYHVVGDAMRTGQADVRPHDADFVLRLRARLQQEPALPALQDAPDPVKIHGTLTSTAKPSANDRWWPLVVGLASVAMVTVVAWQGFQGLVAPDQQLAAAPRTSPATVTLAQSGAAAGAGGAAPVMIRDPHIDALLAAHRQFGGTSALQAPTGFLRNATFEEGAR
ncbi:sigma-E factor negative regulatory protein [Rhodoferax sp.]|uniref:sigma-E factor negative regulatory protein n=1 Tax=Rhodoferax sp. TaxID=50421 RepID=UPI00271B9E5B|nr:sigma-E factor negative regulatory protein [Rhodoferax sp.]MDO9142926.1 sigma-E factor negative regulatory protein [Rhodoferax sp.]MDP3865862.1 sigma-E factor negative regulatory protein [Rhodoferax sp.]